MLYGILKTNQNTGSDEELACVFSTPLSVRSNQPSFVQDSINLIRKAGSQNIQRWEIEASIAPSRGDPGYLIHTVSSGYNKRFYIRMPQVAELVTSEGIVTVENNTTPGTAIPAGASNFAVIGANSLVAGEFIQFTDHSKVYLVVSGGSSGKDVTVVPPLRVAVSAGTRLVLGGNVTMHASYNVDTQLGITYKDGVLSDPGTVKLVERL